MSVERFDGGAELLPDRRTIVTALPLKRAARQRLAELLGARVVDVRETVDHADLVLTPSASPQLIGRLGAKYPGAEIIVVELDDDEFDIELAGPVKRILRGGAARYVVADSIGELAGKLAARRPGQQTVPVHELVSAATVDDLIAAFLQQSADPSTRPEPAATDHVEARRRERTADPDPPTR